MGVADYSNIYQEAAAQYGLDPNLLMAQGMQESSGNPRARGPETPYGRAEGIAQFIPSTAHALGITDPYDPKQAIFGQAKLMAENTKRYGNTEDALKAYHGGTNTKNWGPKTQAYPQQVLKNYKPMEIAQNTVSDDDSGDPFEYARNKKIERDKAEQQAKPKYNAPEMPLGEDTLKSVAAAPFKAVGALSQIPAMAGNAVGGAVGYTGAKIYNGLSSLTGTKGLSDAAENKLVQGFQPFYTGNTSADAVTQAGKAIMGNAGEANPLTGEVLHDPQHFPGRAINALTQGAVAGPAAGFKMIPSLTGAAGSELMGEATDNNPLATLVGGLGGGLTPAAIKATRLRASPEQMADSVIQGQLDNPLNPSGPFSFPHENPIIPGVQNTLSEVTQDPNLALVQRQVRDKNPAGFGRMEDANEAVRNQYFEKASGTPQDVETMVKARESQRKLDTDKIFQPGQEADPTPVISKIDEVLDGPGGERSAVKNTLSKIRGMLVKDKDGTQELTKNPEKLYRSVKHEIEDMMDKKNLNNPEGRQASRELNIVKQALDEAIEKATPGYKQYLDNYSKASAKIDAAEWLQGLKLTDAGGNYTLAKVKNALENAKKLQGSHGINDAKHLTKNQMETLQNLHDDLSRRETPVRTSGSRNSWTKQNLYAEQEINSLMGTANHLMGGKGPELIGSVGGAMLGRSMGAPGAGAFLGDLGARGIKAASAKIKAAADAKIEEFVLNPESYKNYLLNRSGDTYGNRLVENLLKKP